MFAGTVINAKTAVVSLVLLCALGDPARTDEIYRPTSINEIAEEVPAKEKFVRVKGASVAWADHAALRRDFQQLRTRTNTEIERWVLDNFAYISEGQLKLNGIRNTPIPVNNADTKIMHRPRIYDRAAIMEAGKPGQGLVDVKGAGLADGSMNQKQAIYAFKNVANDMDKLNSLRTLDHSDGMMSLGEAIAEVTRQNAAQKLFDLHNAAHGTRLQTVESYFIISIPSGILKKDNEAVPAALYGRQAHIGLMHNHGLEIPPSIYTDMRGGKQKTGTSSAIDFGGVVINNKKLAHNYNTLPVDTTINPQTSKPWIWGHDTAKAYVSGDHDAVYRHVREMTGPIQREWQQTAGYSGLKIFANPLTQAEAAALEKSTTKSLMEKMITGMAKAPEAEKIKLINGLSYVVPHDEEKLLKLASFLKDKNHKIRLAAIEAFTSVANMQKKLPAAIQLELTRLVLLESDHMAYSAAEALGYLQSHIPELETMLAKALHHANESGKTILVLETLGNIRASQPAIHSKIASMFTHADASVRIHAADVVYKLAPSDHAVRLSLAGLLRDPSTTVRSHAINALAKCLAAQTSAEDAKFLPLLMENVDFFSAGIHEKTIKAVSLIVRRTGQADYAVQIALAKAVSNSDPLISLSAANALLAIRPEYTEVHDAIYAAGARYMPEEVHETYEKLLSKYTASQDRLKTHESCRGIIGNILSRIKPEVFK